MNDVKQFRVTPRWHWALSKKNAKSGFAAVHYAAIESNRELDKSLKVIALLLLIFGPNMIILFLTCVKP